MIGRGGDAHENLAVPYCRIGEPFAKVWQARGNKKRNQRGYDRAQHRQFINDDSVGPGRNDGHSAGGQWISQLCEAGEPETEERSHYAAKRSEEKDARLGVIVGKIIAIEGLRRNHDNLPFADAERTSRELQRVDGALCRVGIGIERIHSFHRDKSVAKGSASLTPAVARAPLGSKATAWRR